MQQFAGAAVILAVAIQVVAAYNYNYGGNYGYASMGDVDWGKRSSAYDPWASLGMADADWGWKKRNGDGDIAAPASTEEDEDGGKGSDDVEKKSTVGARPMYYNRYTFNKYHPAPSSSDPVTLASRTRRPSYNYQPQRSRSAYDLGNMYGYHSMADTDWGKKRSSFSAYDPWTSLGMADADWGWKKRKRTLDKRHIAHWAARGNGKFRPRRFTKGFY